MPSAAGEGGFLEIARTAEKDMEEDAQSASSLIAGVTASTASGSANEGGEAVTPHDAGETLAAGLAGAAGQKHPLHNTWCLWVLLHSQGAKESWQKSQMNIHTFSAVEDFWRLFNNIKSPSKLGIIDFSVFKKDIAPAWEDETCRRGGRWVAKIDKSVRQEDFDELWLNVVLTIIGEGLGAAGLCVCGAVVSSRNKTSKMQLWISEREEKKAMVVGRAFRSILQDAGFRGVINFEDFSNESKATYTLSCKMEDAKPEA
jgi:translation initiation factor 4E